MDNLSLILLTAIFGLAAAAPMTASKGSTVCTSAGWDDFVIFFITNYLTHAATAVRYPGETSNELNSRRGDSLLAPYIGLMYALRKIQWSLVLERDDLKRACRGEALVQFIRSCDWKPIQGSLVKASVHIEPCLAKNLSSAANSPTRYCYLEIKQTEQSGPKPVLVTKREKREMIQGLCHLPPGYTILRCQGVPVLRINEPVGQKSALYYDHRVMESILALCQIVFSIVTLYRARGFQFGHIGCASSSLTVLPFASMSFANLIANCLSVDYPLFHIVGSPEFEEAKAHGAKCTAVVGQLIPDLESERLLKSMQFLKTNGTLHAFVMSETQAAGEDLGEVLSADELAYRSGLMARLTIPSNTRILEESPTPASKEKFRQAWRFLRTRDNIGGVLCIPIGVLLFTTPSIVMKLLTRFQSQAPFLQTITFLSWIYFQHFALLFLLCWNVVFDVEHSLRAPSRYSRPLKIGLGYILRVVGVAGYICVIFQIRQYGLCVQV